MTNYNERLDKIVWKTLRRHKKMLNGPVPSDILYSEKEPTDIIFEEAKQALTSLIKELVADAKPEEYEDYYAPSPVEKGWRMGYNEAAREFEYNLLKALNKEK